MNIATKIIIAAALLAAWPALAQVTDVVVVPAPEPEGFFGEYRPYLQEVVAIIMGGAALVALRWFQQLTGIQLDAGNRDSFQRAAQNAGALVTDALIDKATGKRLPLTRAKLQIGVNYMKDSAPDAIKYFGLSEDEVAEKIVPKVLAAEQAVPDPVPAAPPLRPVA